MTSIDPRDSSEVIYLQGGLTYPTPKKGRVAYIPLSEHEAEVARLRDALADIADGYERHNPGWWIKRAKAALAGYRQESHD
jgi:hypothetical protein